MNEITTTTATIEAAERAGRNYTGDDIDTYARERMADFCTDDNPEASDTACQHCSECPYIVAIKRGFAAR